MGERRALSLYHAVALGLLQGPSELLPVSSSGHTTLVAWLAGWPYSELEPERRKSFEVALHAGTAAALIIRPPGDRLEVQPSFLMSAVIPPALVGYVLGARIERRLGTPTTIAAGLLLGSVAMIAGELRARAVDAPRRAIIANTAQAQDSCSSTSTLQGRDGFALGLAQALALIPGVSRSGATLAAARARGFSREDCDRLSWSVSLPVIAGAALLKGTRLARGTNPRELGLPLALGAGSAFLSTLASTKLLRPERRAALLPACTAYRGVLALLVIRRMRDNTR